jgi:hypothetical protein
MTSSEQELTSETVLKVAAKKAVSSRRTFHSCKNVRFMKEW